MKISHLLLTLCITVFLCSCQESKTQKTDNNQLKVLSWNIWHGGHAKAYPKIGCEGTIGILKESKADVILMIETYGAAHQVADSLHYYHRLLSSNLSIYSRYPIIKTYTFPDSISTFNFGGVLINKNGKKIRLFDTWIHYLPDSRLAPTDKSKAEIIAWETAGTRDDEIKRIINVLQPFIAESDSIPIIMGGDFNSHSHLDWTEATKDMYHHGGAVVKWPVSECIINAGFKDSFREFNPDPVKNIGTSWLSPVTNEGSPEAAKRSDRIDYIYYMGNKLSVRKSNVYDNDLGQTFTFRGKDFFYGSDHGFVLTDFNIK